MTGENLLGVPETRLADEPEVAARIQNADGDHDTLGAIAADHPQSSLVWALLADSAYVQGDRIASYSFARVGYHRGLDSLRKSGWKGQGPVPWSHEPNRGVLRSLYALRRAAAAIGEEDEVSRLSAFLRDADPTAAGHIEAATAGALPPTEAIVIRGQD
ncbi:hypothetical protein JOE38_002739 [Clavibacter michiganensis]|uniref:DUF3151 domain-containing protein n=1 Tax=Clavibacter michiganensis TaxID=28447 RepID=UPI00195DEDCB|nr:DUF3151 domain-containing protein [Clavibacter michiganensis]MBM7412916.1 hypothetical protein [Clavibacter michiganensis]